jgi:hypothetical protein
MSDTEKKDLTFSSLVRAIDEKHGHTYEDPPPEPEEDERQLELPLDK